MDYFIIFNQYTVQVFSFVCHLTDNTDAIVGCRSGESCPFIHDASRSAASAKQPNQRRNAQEPTDGTASARTSNVNAVQPTGSITRDNAASLQPAGRQPLQPLRPVPIAQQKDPRAFQISQVKRRFSPEEVRALLSQICVLCAVAFISEDPELFFEFILSNLLPNSSQKHAMLPNTLGQSSELIRCSL